MAMHNPPHPGEFITEVYLEPWIVGLAGLVQAFRTVMIAVVAVGGEHVLTSYQQGYVVGQVIGSMLVLAFALWLRRKGLARIKARKEAEFAS